MLWIFVEIHFFLIIARAKYYNYVIPGLIS